MKSNEENERVFEDYLRSLGRRDGELAIGDDGVLVPSTIANRILKQVYDLSPILQRSKIYHMKGKLRIPYYDEADKGITAAFAEDFKEVVLSVEKLKSIELDGYLARASYFIPLQLVNNTKFPIVDFIVKEIVDTISSFIENEILNGTEGKIEGLSKLENKITSAASNDITADEIIDLWYKVKWYKVNWEFQRDAIWIMHPYTSQVLRRLKDDAGRYLLEPYYDIAGSFSSTLLGRPVYVSDNMPKMEGGKTAIYYGDMSGLAVKISDIEFSIDKGSYISSNAAGVFVFLRFDAKVQDPQKIAKLVMC